MFGADAFQKIFIDVLWGGGGKSISNITLLLLQQFC